MTRVLTFEGKGKHKIYFQMLCTALLTRGSAEPSTRVSTEERRLDGKVLRQIKAISDPIGAEPKIGEQDQRARELKETGGTLNLTQTEWKHLEKYIEQTQWVAAVTDILLDFEEWFSAAEKVETE